MVFDCDSDYTTKEKRKGVKGNEKGVKPQATDYTTKEKRKGVKGNEKGVKPQAGTSN